MFLLISWFFKIVSLLIDFRGSLLILITVELVKLGVIGLIYLIELS